MDFSSLSRPIQYATIFVASGLIAVIIKAASEMGENRVSGLIAMAPMKVLIAWTIVGAAAGSRGIAESTTGMFMGLGAFAISIGSVRLLSPHLGPGGLIGAGLGIWVLAAVLMEWSVRFIRT